MRDSTLLALLKLHLVFSFDDNVLLVGRGAHVGTRGDHSLAVGPDIPIFYLGQVDICEASSIDSF